MKSPVKPVTGVLVCLLIALPAVARSVESAPSRVAIDAPAALNASRTPRLNVSLTATDSAGQPFSGDLLLHSQLGKFAESGTNQVTAPIRGGAASFSLTVGPSDCVPARPILVWATRDGEMVASREILVRQQEDISMSVSPLSVPVGGAQRPVGTAIVRDQFGAPLPDVPLTWSFTLPGGVRGKLQLPTNAEGKSVFQLPPVASAGYGVVQAVTQRLASVQVLVLYAASQPPVAALRDSAGDLGLKIAWDGASRTAHAVGNTGRLRVRVGSHTAILDGREVALESAPVLKEGRLLLPISFLCQILGAREPAT